MKAHFTIDKLKVKIYKDPRDLGGAAANLVVQKLNAAIAQKGIAHLILATGTSQFSFLKMLKKKVLDWDRIVVFHLDEYKGIPDTHPASFRKYLRERILDEVGPKRIHFIHGDADNLEEEMENYAKALRQHPVDMACIGIGENGHIAFNDPPVADFNDPKWVKIVDLDENCRKQQLGEGWFPSLGKVPRQAVTLTIPAIMQCKAISCVVPDERKAPAVYNTLYGPIETACPASILRTHQEAVLFLDQASASKVSF